MKFFIYIFISLVIISSNNRAEDINTLLNIYAQKADLSNKTKKESAGHLIVYTRQDIERMQIKSLYELLKNIVPFRYNENTNGYTDLTYVDFQPSKSNSFRVYINDHEIVTPFFGNGLTLLSQLDFSFVDHAEIYRGIPSFEFGVEPASYVVKLYTKDPKREVGGRISSYISSNSGTNMNAYYADVLDDFSYIGYINTLNLRRDEYNNQGTELSRDKDGYHGYISVQNENNKLEITGVKGTTKNFMGNSSDGTPLKAEGEGDYFNAGLSSYFMDKTLKLSIGYQENNTLLEEEDDTPLGFNSSVGFYNTFKRELEEKMLTIKLKKDISYKDNDLKLGLQYRDKNFDMTKLELNGISIPLQNGYNNEKIYSAFIENNYLFDDNQMLIASIKNDLVRPNGDINNHDLWMGRLGYIYTMENTVFKTFYSHMEFKAEPVLYVLNGGENGLKPEIRDTLTAEIAHTFEKNSFKLLGYLQSVKDNIYLNATTVKYENYDEDVDLMGINIDYTYAFDELNKIDMGYFIDNAKDNKTATKDTTYGGYIKLLNTYQKLDIYNGLIYRDGYEGLSAGYDYNFAITYHYSRDFSLAIKGENVFNSALESKYRTVDVTNPTNVTTVGPVSVIDQKFWITMEYLF